MTNYNIAKNNSNNSGSALIVALWSLLILSLLISSFAFEMQVEAAVTSYYRKRIKAQYIARAGAEWAKALLVRSATAKLSDEVQADEDEALVEQAIRLSRGMAIHGQTHHIGEGFFELDIIAEEGRRNVNNLSDEDWEEILDQANIPEERWSELIDCFSDWVDKNEESHLNGAESDDEFYEERGYECKNAPLDTVDELLLIKGFDHDVVYGTRAKTEDELPMRGIAQWLTVWGNNRVNINTATREVLMTIPGIDEWMVEEILSGRAGLDGELGTRDDGFISVSDAIDKANLPREIASLITTIDHHYVRVISIGEVEGVRAGIWAILRLSRGKSEPVFWREENME